MISKGRKAATHSTSENEMPVNSIKNSNPPEDGSSLDFVEALAFFWSMRFWIVAGIVSGNLCGLLIVSTIRRPHYITTIPYEVTGPNSSIFDPNIFDHFNHIFRTESAATDVFDHLSKKITPWAWDRSTFIFRQTGMGGEYVIPLRMVAKLPTPQIEWIDNMSDPTGKRVEEIMAFVVAFQIKINEDKIRAQEKSDLEFKKAPDEIANKKKALESLLNIQIKEEASIKAKILELDQELRTHTDPSLSYFGKLDTDLNWENIFLDHLAASRKKISPKAFDDYLVRYSKLMSEWRTIIDKNMPLKNEVEHSYVNAIESHMREELRIARPPENSAGAPPIVKLNEADFHKLVAAKAHERQESAAPFIFVIMSVMGAIFGGFSFCIFDFWRANRARIMSVFRK